MIVCFEVGFIYAAYSKRDQLKNIVDNRLDYTLHNAGKNKAYYASWHLLQTELKCCGIVGLGDWNNVLPNNTLPGSCCQKDAEDKTCTNVNASKTGCKAALIEYMSSHIVSLVGIAIGVVAIQVSVV